MGLSPSELPAYCFIYMLKQVGTFGWIAAGRHSETDRGMMKSPDKFKDMLYRIVDNAYFKFGCKLWHQALGMPMGTDCAGCIATCSTLCMKQPS